MPHLVLERQQAQRNRPKYKYLARYNRKSRFNAKPEYPNTTFRVQPKAPPISRRTTDGYFNATAICKANGKRWTKYRESDRANEYLEALSAEARISVFDRSSQNARTSLRLCSNVTTSRKYPLNKGNLAEVVANADNLEVVAICDHLGPHKM